MKTITKGCNIFVNPAWNWGVKNSSSRFTCLLNDDIDATGDLLEYAVSILHADSGGAIGLIGMDRGGNHEALTHRQVTERGNGFGEAMFFRTNDYFPIPRRLKIWCGDDYLFLRMQLSGKQIAAIAGRGRAENDPPSSSQTINSDRHVFKPILEQDEKFWYGYYRKLLLFRYRPISTIRESIRYRMGKIFPR